MDDAELARTLVTEAARIAVSMRVEGISAQHKTSTADLVTAADRAAEARIQELLRIGRPGDGLTGEEGARWASRTGRRWVADPIDGTYNFVSGLVTWCSAVALEEAGRVPAAAVHVPGTRETWVAAGGRVELNGAEVGPLEDRSLSECSVATYLDATNVRDPLALAVVLAVVGAAATLRVSGSGTCDLADVAAGRLGLWIQEDCADWDWLPGRALVEGVGGRAEVIEHAGRRWHVAGPPRAVGEALDVVRRS